MVLVGSQIGANIEQVVLDALYEGLLRTIGQQGGKESEMAVKFVDGAVGLEADAGLRYALTTYQ